RTAPIMVKLFPFTKCHGRQGFHSSRARDCYLPCQSCRSSSSCKVNRTMYHYSIQVACGRALTVCKIFRSPAAFYCYRLAFLRPAFVLIVLCRFILLNERRKRLHGRVGTPSSSVTIHSFSGHAQSFSN